MTNLVRWLVALTVFTLVVFPYARWGSITLRPPETITVSGMAQQEEQNELAQFYVGVTATNADKQAAIDEVNTKMDEVIAKLKEFGIPAADIKTQSVSVYQDQEQVTEGGRMRYVPGTWRANNSVQIKLRDVAKTSDLLALLGGSGLTDISGPNFMIDPDDQAARTELMKEAVDQAKEKAAAIAQANGKKLTKIVNVTEGYAPSYGPMLMDRAMGGGAAPIEPGTSTVQATVTVTFEMK
jgi:uncharacterized protein YggE